MSWRMRSYFNVVFGLLSGVTFVFGHAHEGVAVEQLVQSTVAWNGEMLPTYPAGQPEVTLLRITIPPGSRLPLHKHPVINCGYLLEGALQVTSEAGDTLLLREGEPLVELVDRWHYGENRGETPVVILVFYAGIEGQPITITKAARDSDASGSSSQPADQ